MTDVPQETQAKETQPETAEQVEKGKSPQAEPTLVDKAREERERLEKARNEANAAADRLEKLRASEMLGGSSDAGNTKPKKKDPKELANDLMAGNMDMSDFLDI